MFGRDPPSPEILSFEMPVHPIPSDHYAPNLVSRLQDDADHFTQIKSDLKRRQRDHYDSHARHITIPDGKIVYVCKDHVPSHTGLATRFVRNFDGPFIVLGHPYSRSDLLTLRHVATNNDLSHPINVEKVTVVPEPDTYYLQVPNDAIVDTESDSDLPVVHTFRPQRYLMQVAFESGNYFQFLPSKSSAASQACKFVYQS